MPKRTRSNAKGNGEIIMVMANTQNVKNVLVIVGFVMTITAIFTAGYVYQSFAIDPLEKGVYAIFGIVFAVLGALFLPSAGILWQNQHAILAFICILLWAVVLFVIGTQTHLGFMAYAQNKADNASASALAALKLKQGLYDSANKKAADLSGLSALDVESEKQKLESLKSRLQSERDNLAACPKGYIKNCIKPTESKIATLESQISALESSIKNANSYHAAVLERDKAALELASLQSNPSQASNANDTVHPLFISQANVLGLEAKKMQSYFLAFSAVSFEALTAIVWLVVGLLGKTNIIEGSYSQVENRAKSLNNDKPLPLNNPLPNDKGSLKETVALAKEETNSLAMGKL